MPLVESDLRVASAHDISLVGQVEGSLRVIKSDHLMTAEFSV